MLSGPNISHKSIDDAIEYLRNRGIENPKIVDETIKKSNIRNKFRMKEGLYLVFCPEWKHARYLVANYTHKTFEDFEGNNIDFYVLGYITLNETGQPQSDIYIPYVR